MNKQLDIFLLIGQSNMYGCGDPEDVPPIEHPQVFMYQSGKWIQAKDPLHVEKPVNPSVGLGMSFAVSLLETFPDMNVGIVQCAFGGTPLSSWVPGAKLYENAVSLVGRSGSNGILRGILWHQGESDADAQANAETYAERFSGMIQGFRSDLSAHDVPFISGELGRFLESSDRFVFYDTINRSLNAAGVDVGDRFYRCVSSAGLKDKGDGLHFNSRSLRDFGIRYAREFIKIVERV